MSMKPLVKYLYTEHVVNYWYHRSMLFQALLKSLSISLVNWATTGQFYEREANLRCHSYTHYNLVLVHNPCMYTTACNLVLCTG